MTTTHATASALPQGNERHESVQAALLRVFGRYGLPKCINTDNGAPWGKHRRGAGGKTIVFGLRGRGDCVYIKIVPNASKATLQAIIRGKVDPNSVIHTDGWRGYDGLVDLGLGKHFWVNHGNNEFVKGCRHVNGIESFWSYAKHRLAQFHGVRHDKFALHLKETEFRFNHRHLDLYKTLLKLLRDEPL